MKSYNNIKKIASIKLLRNMGLAMVIVLTLAMISEAINFSGDWTLNNEKSNFGNSEFRNAANKLKITQDASKITIERSGTRRNGEAYTYSEIITLDGKECENTINQGRKRKSTASWSADAKSLTIGSSSSMERNGQTMEMKSTEIYTLADNVLTVDVTSSSQRGEMKNKLIYEKK